MATAEEGGATATAATSSYGGEGGAGGKFRKKPFRRQATPYDRPAIAAVATASSRNLFSKLVDLPSRFISYGARRFFDSVIRKRLLPPPPQIPDSNLVLSNGPPEAAPSEPAGGESSQTIRNSGRNEISDLERLLKQKTFTRSEIDHLTELLHSRGEVSLRDDGKRNEETVPHFGSHQQIESCAMEAHISKQDRHNGVMSSPISNSKVLVDNIASPAEHAKTYMGGRPSELSQSVLSDNRQVTKEKTNLLSNTRFASRPGSLSLTTNALVGSGSPENGYITKPSSLRRSAIYNMTRSPYAKRTGVNNASYAGLPLTPTSLSIAGNSERSESKAMTLKRRSSALDDQVGSVGHIRRIRQKSNLIASGVPYADRVGRNSEAMLVSSKQKHPLIDDPLHAQRTGGSTDVSIPSTSYAIVPYESNNEEVVERRPGNLEKTALRDKSESKVVAVGQKSPFKLTSSMLQGQALKSMEDVTYSELLMDIQDDQKFESTAGLLGAHDFPPQEQGEVKENGPVETSAPSDRYYPVIDNDSAVIDGTSDYVERERDLSQPQSRAAFRMSALEDFVDLDDDPTCNGVASRPFSEGRGSAEAHSISTAKQFSPPEEPKVLEPAIQPELKSPLDLLSSKTNKVSSSVAGAVSLGKGSNGIITLASEEVTAAALPTVPPSVASFNKPKEINNPSSIFSFSSKVEDKFPSLVPESSSIPESSSSLLDVSAPASSPSKVVDPEKGGFLKPLAAEDTSRNFDTVATAASNGPLVSGAPAVSFAATSNNNNAHQISTAAPAIFTPSVSVSDCIPSGSGSMSSTTSSGLIFGAAEAPKGLGEPAFKFGVSPDPSAKVSAVSTTSGPTFKFGVSHDPSAKVSEASITIPPVGDLKNNALTNLSSGITTSSSTKFVAFGAPSSGDMTPGFSSSTNISSGNNSQGSLFSSENKSFPPIAGNVSQGTSAQSFSLAPQSTANSSPSFVPTIPSSQVSSPTISFGLNSSASSADAGAVVSNSGPTSSLFGANPSALSNGSAGGSSSFTTSPFSFGFGSSSSATNMIESTGGTTASGFSFGASPSGPSPATITIGSTIGTTTSGFSFGASSSCSSPATNTVGSTGSTTSSSFSFGASPSASSPATNTIGSIGATTAPGFSFGAASSPATNTIGSTGATTSGFSFGMSSSASPPATNTIGSTGATNASGFSFGASSTGSAPTTTSFFSTSPSTGAVGSTGGTTASGFSFGVSSSGSAPAPTSIFSGASSSANAIGSTGGAMPVFGFGLSPASTSASNGASPFSNGASSVFQFGGSSSSSFSAINSTISSNPPPNAFGSSLQAPTSSVFGSSPATGFSFGATATSSAPINSAPTVFGATATSSSSPFSFTSSSVFSSPSPTPVFGNAAPAFAAPTSPGNNFQMNGEDSMAEDPVQSTAPPVAVFGGQASFPPAPGFMPGPSVPSQPNPFQFGGQPNQGVPQNPFQASGEFNAGGGSFSLGSGGDKAGRKYVKANRNKNRKK